jgi:hypothetical protein
MLSPLYIHTTNDRCMSIYYGVWYPGPVQTTPSPFSQTLVDIWEALIGSDMVIAPPSNRLGILFAILLTPVQSSHISISAEDVWASGCFWTDPTTLWVCGGRSAHHLRHCLDVSFHCWTHPNQANHPNQVVLVLPQNMVVQSWRSAVNSERIFTCLLFTHLLRSR